MSFLAGNAVQAQDQGTLPTSLPHDLSVMGMFEQADLVVKSVMLLLLAFAVVAWVIWLAKWFELIACRRALKISRKALNNVSSLTEAAALETGSKTHIALLLAAGEQEVRLSDMHALSIGSEGLKERVHSRLARLQSGIGRKLQRSVGLLATIGSTAPFIGLFGTVWGIMNAFIGIAETQTTNLAVVAPGIAEALLATALGLVAAIPAVVFYNGLSRGIANYKQNLADTAAFIERLVSRDRDMKLSEALTREGHS
ncbi:tonB-system energizer ExbB [Devosia sp. WQ 349]|uniref:tonB-system energizer ExbB n=1 Tax=Devosia sp. WQ 349K1 TaxID=2800329 RepID=UPI0019062A59|nr:tonB-system energizer ExbB [Devosia sp. WQ 349K1]